MLAESRCFKHTLDAVTIGKPEQCFFLSLFMIDVQKRRGGSAVFLSIWVQVQSKECHLLSETGIYSCFVGRHDKRIGLKCMSMKCKTAFLWRKMFSPWHKVISSGLCPEIYRWWVCGGFYSKNTEIKARVAFLRFLISSCVIFVVNRDLNEDVFISVI